MSKLRKSAQERAQLQAQLDAKLLRQLLVIAGLKAEGQWIRAEKGRERTPPVTLPEETEGVTE